MNRLDRFLRLLPGDRRLLVEASLLVVGVRLALWLLPFRLVLRLVAPEPSSRRMTFGRVCASSATITACC